MLLPCELKPYRNIYSGSIPLPNLCIRTAATQSELNNRAGWASFTMNRYGRSLYPRTQYTINIHDAFRYDTVHLIPFILLRDIGELCEHPEE